MIPILILLATLMAGETQTTEAVTKPTPAAETNAPVTVTVDTNKPIRLLSGTTNPPPELPRIPVHVISEAVVVHTPMGQIVFVERVDVERLARLFPAIRLTNIVIYNR